MRKPTGIVASALLLGGVVVASPAAWAGSDDDFTLTGEFTDFDRKGHGHPSEGDEFSFAFDLFETDGDDAGDGDGTCELTELDRRHREFAADCEVVFELDHGDLEMEGEVTDEDFEEGKVVLDVVGGTGDYEDAEGKATFRPARHHHKGHGHRHARYEAAGGGDYGPDHDRGHRRGHRHHGHDHRDFKVHVELD